ncbi:glycosyltransferase family 2 protein [Planktotalea sp.]|uniref:glycosyltransferase family 2 protein n=1 Tax=Planktotalea sp. TaxID=2029877 RepID=UPI0025F5AC5F|nr:glycosyltransferase family 2 protein [Planktotalea sp.]
MHEPKWGIVSTVKAPMRDVLGFVAYHLERGAHRIYIYLDAPDAPTFTALKSHSKVRVTQTDAAYWDKRGGRPAKHQPRQTINAADAYGKRVEVDWLTHIDHDEFFVWDTPLTQQLSALDARCLCGRIRPIEALAWEGAITDPRPFKGFALPMPERRATTQALYPTYGAHLNGGFLSHVAGKMIYRTGIEGLSVKIHNAFLNGDQNPGQQELLQTRLCHLHGETWEAWRASFEYRKSKGAYRDEFNAPFDKDKGGLNMHTLLSQIENEGGEAGLKAFYHEVCTARPALLDGLDEHGLLHWRRLNRGDAIARQFPDYA